MTHPRLHDYRDMTIPQEEEVLALIRRLDTQLYNRQAVYLSKHNYNLLRQRLIDESPLGSKWRTLGRLK